jgi:hypothetical protein
MSDTKTDLRDDWLRNVLGLDPKTYLPLIQATLEVVLPRRAMALPSS